LLLPFEELQGVAPGEAAHLLESLDRHERSQRLAFALDDELVVAERHPVEQVTDPLANVNGGHLILPWP